MAITFWRNVLRKLTTTEMDANFDTLVTMIDGAGLSPEMPEGQIYIGDNTNTASLETLDKALVGLSNVDNTSDANKPISIAGMASNSTGVKTGGVISIGTGGAGVATTFTIASGVGMVVDNTTIPATLINVSWSAKTDVVVTNIGTQPLTFVAIDSAGNVIQQATDFSGLEHRLYIVIGSVIHTNLTTVTAVNQAQHLAISPQAQLNDLFQSLAGFNITGNIFSANGANLNINKSAGEIFKQGANYATSANNPNIVITASLTAGTFRYNNQTGNASGILSAIDPNNYDLAGVTTAVSVNKFTIQRIFLFSSNLLAIQRGQIEYNSLAEAKASIQTETFVVNPSIIPNGVLRAYLIVRQGTTALNSATSAFFLEAPKFGGTAGVGGLSVSTLQNAYDNSISPEILTDATRGALTVKRGSGADTDLVLEVLNGAGTVTSSVDGNGLNAMTNASISSATASTVPYFDASKKLVSSAVTPTQLSYLDATSSIQTQLNAKAGVYTLTNYVKVDLQNGVDGTALINRVDKPFLTLQAAYNAVISAGGTNAYYFDIVGDATITSNILTMTSTRGLFTFNFSGKITSSIVNVGATKGLFSNGGFTVNGNKYIFNSDFVQTTNVGMGIGSGSYNQFTFNGNTTLKNPKGSQDSYGFYVIGNYNSFYAKNLTWDITNDTGVTPYVDVFQIGTYPNIFIETLIVTGASTVAYRPVLTYGVNISNLIINNIIWNVTYTNLTGMSLTDQNTTIDNCELRNVSIASNSGLKSIAFNLLNASSIKTLKIGNASLLAGFFDIYCNTINDCYLGNIVTTGRINDDYLPFISGVIRVGKVTRTVASTLSLFCLKGSAKLIGGVISFNNTIDTIYNAIKLHYTASSTKYVEINGVSFQNIGIPATSSEGAPFIRAWGTLADPCYLLLRGCTFSGTAGNTNVNTTVFKNEADVANNTFIIEGDLATNYFGTVPTGVTVNADVKLITNLQI